MQRRFALVIFFATFLVGCAGPNDRPHRVFTYEGIDPKDHGDTFEWNRRSPIELLMVLQQREYCYSITGVHHNWIRESDVEPLMALLDSETPCAPVKMTISSFSSFDEKSTVGHEAAYLLEGYRQHFYPFELNSSDFKPDKDELRQWFRGWSERKTAEYVR